MSGAVFRVRNREISANTYLVPLDRRGDCLMIDPGLDLAAIEAALVEHRLTPTAVICTHGHFDHVGTAAHFGDRYAIPVHLHSADVAIANRSNLMMMALKMKSRIILPASWVILDDGIQDAGFGVSVVHAPGHTPGSVVLRVGDMAFTGDMLSRIDVSRAKWPEHDQERLIASVRRIWDQLADDTMIYPGHGQGAAFGSIKRQNAPLRRLVSLAG